jgi:hypothetical protein
MKIINVLKFAVPAALAVALLSQTSITRADDHGKKGDQGPRKITFQKCFVPDTGPFGGHFEGTVGGDCGAGKVVFTYLSVIPGDPIVRFAGEYNITGSQCPFKAVCAGTVNIRTGHIVLNGVVTDGPMLGDRVQVRAQANADISCSQGTMTITPSEQE